MDDDSDELGAVDYGEASDDGVEDWDIAESMAFRDLERVVVGGTAAAGTGRVRRVRTEDDLLTVVEGYLGALIRGGDVGADTSTLVASVNRVRGVPFPQFKDAHAIAAASFALQVGLTPVSAARIYAPVERVRPVDVARYVRLLSTL